MQDRDLIVGVLAAQAGFATPSEVLTAAAAGLVGPESLLTRLERSGTLSSEQRRILEALVDQALVARNGDANAVLTSLGTAPAVIDTLVSALGAVREGGNGEATGTEVIPLERPGQYTRLGELGRGSQSIVRVARDEFVGREVALKELVTPSSHSDYDSSRAAQARFLREARLVAGLDHPGIVSILELARRDDGTLFCAQKLIRGETLQVRLARCRTSSDRLELLRHVLDACQAMGFAHSKRVIHRDLKPSNIMVGGYGETVVVDWGLAKHRDETDEAAALLGSTAEPHLTVAGVAFGTPAYMSPEQARGDLPVIDARSDVFSLGAILYQVLTGRPPFEGVNSDHILENARAGRFPPVLTVTPDARGELAAIAERALRPDPAERYQDAEELATELSAYLSGGRVAAYQYRGWELFRKFIASHRALTAGVGVALGALVVSAIVVAVRLQMTHRDLARSFVEQAYAAERELDWAMAATYFAAARAQHDTAEARWGVALASELAVEHLLSLRGPPGSMTDVDVLPDGRMVVLGVSGKRVEVREIEGGKTLWARELEPIAAASFVPGGQVLLSLPSGRAFFDGATGHSLGSVGRQVGRPCRGRHPVSVVALRGHLIATRVDGTFASLATDVHPDERCAVSDDGQQVGYLDSSGRISLLSVADGRKLGERDGTGFRYLLHSRHGLVIVRQGSVDLLGGPEGDFTIVVGEPAAAGAQNPRLGGVALSPDGNLLVIARVGSSRADVVDLRRRLVRGMVHYAQGWPRFAFSLDGRQVYTAGLGGGSRLDAWRLPPEDAPTGHPGNWPFWSVAFSPSGRQLVILDASKPALELHGVQGGLLARRPVSEQLVGTDIVREGLVVVAGSSGDEVVLLDLEHDREVWRHHCQVCSPLEVSMDGSRLASVGLNGLEVWDARADRVLFTETARLNGFESAVSLSPDGERVAWTDGASMRVRNLASGHERTLDLESPATRVRFSPDSRLIAVITAASLSLFDAQAGRSLWTVPHATPDRPIQLAWSADLTSLLVWYQTLGTELLDARNGVRLGRFPSTGSVVPVVSPDLRTKLVATGSNWDLRPLPQPASDSPSDGLATTLRKTGLALEGVEIVAR